MYSLDLLKFKA